MKAVSAAVNFLWFLSSFFIAAIIVGFVLYFVSGGNVESIRSIYDRHGNWISGIVFVLGVIIFESVRRYSLKRQNKK